MGIAQRTPGRTRRGADLLQTLPGRVVEVFCRTGVLGVEEVSQPVAGGWPVIEVETRGPVDVDLVVRRVRQAVAPPGQ